MAYLVSKGALSAVGAAEGLVVPVLRDTDGLSFAEIEKGIKKFAQQARDRTRSLENRPVELLG